MMKDYYSMFHLCIGYFFTSVETPHSVQEIISIENKSTVLLGNKANSTCIENLLPIPLNEKWIFELTEKIKFKEFYFLKLGNNNFIIDLLLSNDTQIHCKIKYVHELQHILSFCHFT